MDIPAIIEYHIHKCHDKIITFEGILISIDDMCGKPLKKNSNLVTESATMC